MNLRNLALCLVLGGAASCGNDSGAVPGPDAPLVDAAEVADAPVPRDAAPNMLDASMLPDAPVPPDASPDGPIDGPPGPQPTGRFRFVHAGMTNLADPEINFDIYLAGTTTPLMPGVAVGTATEYIALPAGSIQLQVRAAGAGPTDTPLYTSEPFDITESASLTAIGAGLLGSGGTDSTRFRITMLTDRFAAAVPGKARLRIAHDAHTLPTLSVNLGDDTTIEHDSLALFAATPEAGFEVTPGELALTLRGSTGPLTFMIPGAVLSDGADVYAVVAGMATARPRDRRGMQLMLVKAGAAVVTVRLIPSIFVLGAAADLPLPSATSGKLDAFIGDKKVVDNLAFGVNPLVQIPVRPAPSGVALEFFPHTTDQTRPSGPALATFTTDPLEVGQQYLLVLGGLVANLSLHTYKDDMELPRGTGSGRLRAVHEMLGMSRIDVGWFEQNGTTWRDVPGFADLTSGTSSPPSGSLLEGLTLGSSFRPGLRPAGDATAQRRFNTAAQFSTNFAERWFAVAAGTSTPVTGQLSLRFVLVKTTAAGSWAVTIVFPSTTLRAAPRAR
jgi:hypothetical protein